VPEVEHRADVPRRRALGDRGGRTVQRGAVGRVAIDHHDALDVRRLRQHLVDLRQVPRGGDEDPRGRVLQHVAQQPAAQLGVDLDLEGAQPPEPDPRGDGVDRGRQHHRHRLLGADAELLVEARRRQRGAVRLRVAQLAPVDLLEERAVGVLALGVAGDLLGHDLMGLHGQDASCVGGAGARNSSRSSRL
jgi:hypothetical protein